MKNLVLSLLLLTVSLAAVFGVCLLVKDYEYRANYITSVNKEYAEALENLKEEVNVNIENVTELTKEIELKGLTIDDLFKTSTRLTLILRNFVFIFRKNYSFDMYSSISTTVPLSLDSSAAKQMRWLLQDTDISEIEFEGLSFAMYS